MIHIDRLTFTIQSHYIVNVYSGKSCFTSWWD